MCACVCVCAHARVCVCVRVSNICVCEYCLLSRAAATHFIQNIDAIGNHTHAHVVVECTQRWCVCIRIASFNKLWRVISRGDPPSACDVTKYSLEPDALASTDTARDSGGVHRPSHGIKNTLRVIKIKNTMTTPVSRKRESSAEKLQK